MNLLANGGFETNAVGWAAVSSTVTRDTDEKHDGVASCKVVTNGGAATQGLQLISGLPTVRGGEFYVLRGWVKATDGATLTIRWYEVPSVSIRGSVAFTGNGAWQYFEVVGESDGSGAGTVRIQFLTPTDQTLTFYTDGLVFEPLPNPAARAAILR